MLLTLDGYKIANMSRSLAKWISSSNQMIFDRKKTLRKYHFKNFRNAIYRVKYVLSSLVAQVLRLYVKREKREEFKGSVSWRIACSHDGATIYA